MAAGSALGVDIISDSSFSSSETDLDSDGNVRFSEFDSDSRQRLATMMRSWGSVNRLTHLCLPGINRTDHGRTQSLISVIPIPDQPTV